MGRVHVGCMNSKQHNPSCPCVSCLSAAVAAGRRCSRTGVQKHSAVLRHHIDVAPCQRQKTCLPCFSGGRGTNKRRNKRTNALLPRRAEHDMRLWQVRRIGLKVCRTYQYTSGDASIGSVLVSSATIGWPRKLARTNARADQRSTMSNKISPLERIFLLRAVRTCLRNASGGVIYTAFLKREKDRCRSPCVCVFFFFHPIYSGH